MVTDREAMEGKEVAARGRRRRGTALLSLSALENIVADEEGLRSMLTEQDVERMEEEKCRDKVIIPLNSTSSEKSRC